MFSGLENLVADLEDHNPATLLSISAIACIILSYAIRWLIATHRDQAFAAKHGCKPAKSVMPKATDFWLSIKDIAQKTYLETAVKRYAEWSTTYEATAPFFAKEVFTIDPENMKTILATNFEQWELGSRRRLMLRDLIQNSIFVVDGKAWEHSRALLRPSFKKVNTEDTGFFEVHFQELLQVLPGVNDFSGLIDVDLQPLFLRMTLDSATELLLGESFHSQLSHSKPETKAFVDSFDFATRNVYKYDALNNGFLSPLGMLNWALRGGGKDKFTKSCEAVHRAIDDKITQRLQEGFGAADAKEYIFLEGLSQETDDKTQIRDEILSVLFAGRDSTGSLLSNAMFMLARKPEIWNQLREEVMRVTQGDLPDASMLRHMKFLRNILTETLRLFPPIPVNARVANVNTTLPHGGGPDGKDPLFVAAGTRVQYHCYAAHRSFDTYGPSALEWDPSRWDDRSFKPGWGYLPFNGGPRICPGQVFSTFESTYILARMAQEFKSVERRDPKMEYESSIGLSTLNRLGAKVALAKA